MSARDDQMACNELVELATDYLEGALADHERSLLEAHLAKCDGCTAYLEQLRTTIRLTGTLTQDQIPPERVRALLRVFRAWRAETRSP